MRKDKEKTIEDHALKWAQRLRLIPQGNEDDLYLDFDKLAAPGVLVGPLLAFAHAIFDVKSLVAYGAIAITLIIAFVGESTRARCGVLAGWGLITLFWTAMYHFLGAGDSIVIKLVDIGFALGLALLIMARFGIQSKQHTESRWGSKLSNWLWNIWPFAYIGGLLFLLIRWIVNWLN